MPILLFRFEVGIMRATGKTFRAILTCLLRVSEGQNVTYATSTYKASRRAFSLAADICTAYNLANTQLILCNQVIRFPNGKQLFFTNRETRGINPKEIVYDEFETNEPLKPLTRRKAPWLDFEGNELFEGDRIKHPDGSIGQIEFMRPLYKKEKKWCVTYGKNDYASLCLQIGDKGRAVKT